jgi:hypothetical protein
VTIRQALPWSRLNFAQQVEHLVGRHGVEVLPVGSSADRRGRSDARQLLRCRTSESSPGRLYWHPSGRRAPAVHAHWFRPAVAVPWAMIDGIVTFSSAVKAGSKW